MMAKYDLDSDAMLAATKIKKHLGGGCFNFKESDGNLYISWVIVKKGVRTQIGLGRINKIGEVPKDIYQRFERKLGL